jgi:hypothetical protein
MIEAMAGMLALRRSKSLFASFSSEKEVLSCCLT